MADSVDPMNSPDPVEQKQNPMTAIPALAQAATARKPSVVSSVLQRIRHTQPRSSRLPDAAFKGLILLTAASVFAIVVFVVWELVDKSRLSLHQFGIGFFYGHDWDPVNDQYGALPFIFGTLVSSFLAELLAAIPSVVYGLWAIFVLAPLLRDYVEPFLARTLGWTGLFTGPI